MSAHTLPTIELRWTKVHVDIQDAHDTSFCENSVKRPAHQFVESTRRVNSLFGSWFESFIIFNSCDQGLLVNTAWSRGSMVLVYGDQETGNISRA
jgi:hypothetical protein